MQELGRRASQVSNNNLSIFQLFFYDLVPTLSPPKLVLSLYPTINCSFRFLVLQFHDIPNRLEVTCGHEWVN